MSCSCNSRAEAGRDTEDQPALALACQASLQCATPLADATNRLPRCDSCAQPAHEPAAVTAYSLQQFPFATPRRQVLQKTPSYPICERQSRLPQIADSPRFTPALPCTPRHAAISSSQPGTMHHHNRAHTGTTSQPWPRAPPSPCLPHHCIGAGCIVFCLAKGEARVNLPTPNFTSRDSHTANAGIVQLQPVRHL